MIKVQSALGHAVLTLPFALPQAADEDKSAHRPFPSPRKSGEGQVAFTASNVQLLGWLTLADLSPDATSGNDCWGYTSPSGREYAIIGTDNGTAFVEVTDPGAPELVAFRTGPNSLWRDMKVFGDNAYVVSEGGSGIQIFDMSAIDAGTVTLVFTQSSGGCTTATHNVAIDTTSGYLYRCGGGGSPCSGSPQGLVIYDLNANPNNPPAVGLWTTRYVHDAMVVVSTRPGALNGRQLAFCAADDGSGGGNANLHILDVTNKASISTVATATYTSRAFSHQVWLTPDQRYAYLNDELDEASFGITTRTRVFDVSNPAAPTFLGFFTTGVDSIDHNLYVRADNKIFEANYRSGLRIFDNTNPIAPTPFGFFDTWESDDEPEFNSLWSNYPFFPSGTVIGSDMEKGLFVWRLGAAKLAFDFPGGLPEFIGPTGGVVQFEVSENAPGDLLPGTVEFHYATGGPFSTVAATWLGGEQYEAVLPSAACGDTIEYYVSARSSDDVTWTDPPAAPMAQVHLATAAFGQTVALDETFEVNTGWLVNQAADLTGFSTASTGTWVRANPVGTSAQPEDDHTPAPGTICFVTENGAPGGGVGDADIDNGATALRSPVLDASGMNDPYVSYWRWFSNNQGGAPGEDTMTVHISNNGGSSWVLLETAGPTGGDAVGGWIQHSARIADFVAPTNNMRLRFRASDLNSGSIVEAGVDDLQIVDFICDGVGIASVSPANGPFDGGNLVTITGSGFQPGVTTVRFGLNQAAALNVVNSTTIQVLVPRAPRPAGGKLGALSRKVDVVVQNPGTATLVKGYTYELEQREF
jgi:choice-of-anchor B domain-containing protein